MSATLGRSTRKAVALFFILIGAQMVSSIVDASPFIGSPQIDYPALDYKLPFWPQFAVQWLVIGLGSALVTSLGMIAWRDEAAAVVTPRRLLLIWVTGFALIAMAKLAGFLALGTMGGLYVQQPIFRFAVVNGAISATLIVSLFAGVSALLQRLARPRRAFLEFVLCAAGTVLVFTVVMLLIAISTGLPWRGMLDDYLAGIALFGVVIALLTLLTRRDPAAQKSTLTPPNTERPSPGQ